MSRKATSTANREPITLAIAVHAPYNRIKNIESYYQEFINLLKTNGITPEFTQFIKIREINPSTFITRGKVEELAQICEKNNVQRVYVSEQLTGVQERNLEDLFNCSVYDRTRLILEIFQKAALSAEGKKQVEIAILRHSKTRLAGKGASMAQQLGVIGGRGPGERAKEIERRTIEEEIEKLKKQLKQIETVRATQRKQRLEKRIPHICLIGYTNAGKSTILNTLTKAGVVAEDKLFATLDTTTRELYIDHQKIGVISDTVGFIQQLPHQLINAFKATLEELQYADLLLQVIDSSDPNCESHIHVVHEILRELEVDKPMIYVFNKSDAVIDPETLKTALDKYQPHVLVCGKNRTGLEPLIEFLRTWQKPEEK